MAIEIRLHGRGGQGGVTCAKILAGIYAHLGYSVQTFGDYAGERSGAPVRAYTRVSSTPVTNRNKVYGPDHLLVLDPTLLGDEVVSGLAPGGTLLLNTVTSQSLAGEAFAPFRAATVDATAIARRHRIGTRSVVIVNTTIAGAFARALGLPLEALDATYQHLGYASNLAAAHEAYEAVAIREPRSSEVPVARTSARAPVSTVVPLTTHLHGPPTGLHTGSWRTQTPRYVTGLAPCNAFCPAGNDVVGFVQALARGGDRAAAADILAATTPLPGVCGRVCPAPCMDGCNRTELDGAVNIRALERWIADESVAAKAAPPRRRAPAEQRRFAIVGGGPAGLGAAHTLALAGHRVTVFDGERQLGGVLRTGIPAYRLPRAVLDREVNAILGLGVETRLGAGVDQARLAQLPGEFDAVIVATGLAHCRGLDGPGADLPGVEQGISFLRRINLDDGTRMTGHVVVLGGGNTAMDCARSALRAGAARVTVAYRRSRAEMPAIADEIEEALEEGVELLLLRQPLGVRKAGSALEVDLAEVELGQPDDSGRRRPVVTDRLSSLAADAVLLALGQTADLSILPAGWTLADGRIHAAGRALAVFAAGDLATGEGTVTHAIGSGRRAATTALAALGDDTPVFQRPDRALAVPATDIRFDHFVRTPQARGALLPPPVRATRFDEVCHALPDAGEASRCFSCGKCTRCDTCLVYCPEGIIHRHGCDYEVDTTYCKGCGICVTECPRKAMEMTTV